MDIERIKTRLADSAARSDIECYCERYLIDDAWWHDTESPLAQFAQEELREAIAYLKTRGLVERHSENPGWVRFLPAAEESEQ